MSEQPLILVVEDERQIRETVVLALECEGFAACEAATAARAGEQVAQRKPDVIILDLGLPDRDGVDFIRDLRAWSATPILILSARSAEDSKVDALDAGADDYLSKPFGMAELLATHGDPQAREVRLYSVTVSEKGAQSATYMEVDD